ncbi:MAG TPA: DNA repair protein RecO [Caldilineaceae bacterium]|nr:DNA repair protein RecO [Caldilineaceae bacterium]
MRERQRLYRTHAIVLRRRDYSDADRILTVLTPNYGKLELIAKGVRKTTSRKAGHLELFGHSSLLVAKARTWDIITEAVNVESFQAIRSDLDKIGQASYLCELVDCFTESGDENQPLWDLLLIALHALNEQASGLPSPLDEDKRHELDANLLLHWFELHLLSLAGFQPQLFECLNCDAELEPVTNYIHLAEGGVFCPRCAEGRRELEALEPDALKVLRFLQTRSWPVVRRFHVRPLLMQRVGNLLYRYLLSVLERQLKSVDFMRRLQTLPAAHLATPAAAPPAAPLSPQTD